VLEKCKSGISKEAFPIYLFILLPDIDLFILLPDKARKKARILMKNPDHY
jgi:hypothetical protein